MTQGYLKNQPQMYEDLQLFFEDPEADRGDWIRAHSWNKGHGRLEWREMTTNGQMNDFFACEWAGIAQVFRLQRKVWKKDTYSQETVYGFTCLSAAQADPARLLELVRRHWLIENRLHWRRDVTLRGCSTSLSCEKYLKIFHEGNGCSSLPQYFR